MADAGCRIPRVETATGDVVALARLREVLADSGADRGVNGHHRHRSVAPCKNRNEIRELLISLAREDGCVRGT